MSRRRQTAIDPRQGELFRKLSLPHIIVVPVVDGTRTTHVRTPILNVTIAQAEAYSRHRPMAERATRDKGVTAFLETLRPYITSPDQTVGEVLATAERAVAHEP